MMTTTEIWKAAFGASGVSDIFFYSIYFVFLYLFLIVPAMSVLVFITKKTIADQQARIGPKLAGPSGALQGLANTIKLLVKMQTQKESIGMWWSFFLAPIFIIPLLPLSETVFLSHMKLSPLALIFISIFNLFLNFYLAGRLFGIAGFMKSIRWVTVSFMGVLPAIITLVLVLLLVGSSDWSDIIKSQGFWFFEWNMFKHPPFMFLGLLVFIISGWSVAGVFPSMYTTTLGVGAQINDEGRLGANISVMLSAMRFILFFSWSMMSVALFCGGWKLPVFLDTRLFGEEFLFLRFIFESILIISKSFVLMLISNWVYCAMPKTRTDQTTDFLWKVLNVTAVAALFGSLLFYHARFF